VDDWHDGHWPGLARVGRGVVAPVEVPVNWWTRLFWPTRDEAWKPTGIREPERGSWNVATDHDDPRAKRQLLAELRAKKVQAQRRGEDSNVIEMKRRA